MNKVGNLAFVRFLSAYSCNLVFVVVCERKIHAALHVMYASLHEF